MKIKTEILAMLVALAVSIPIGYGGWRLQRWHNWKFSYGAKVEQRIQALENRIEALENEKRKR